MEAQSGGNGTKMVLPLNDTLNGPKRDENGALSSQRFFSNAALSSHQEEEAEAQSGGSGKKMAVFKRHTRRIKM